MSHAAPLKKNFTEGPINRHLVRMTLPMIWGIGAIVSFQLVDTYYISLLGTKKLAAMSYTFPITYGIFSLFIGMGIAVSSVISRLVGEGKPEDVRRVTSHGIALVFLASLVMALIGIPLLGPVFRGMGADEEAITLIKSFMIPYFIGSFFISMPVVGNAALRATGDAIVPAIIMTIAAILNAIIGPFLIFGLAGLPRLELFGAALATIFANFGAMSAGLILMYRRGLFDLAHISNLRHFGDSVRRILVIAIPAGVTSLLPSFLNSTVNHLLSRDSEAAVAAFGAGTRVESVTMIVMMALSIGMAPVIGQNWGARRMDRVRETIRSALVFSFLWACLTALVLLVWRAQLGGLFSDDPRVLYYLGLFFVTVPLSYPVGNLAHIWGSVFNAIGQPRISATLFFTKLIILGIPAAIAGYGLDGVRGVFLGLAAVNILTGAAGHIWAWRYMDRMR